MSVVSFETYKLHTTFCPILPEEPSWFFITGSRGHGISQERLAKLLDPIDSMGSIEDARQRAAIILDTPPEQIEVARYLHPDYGNESFMPKPLYPETRHELQTCIDDFIEDHPRHWKPKVIYIPRQMEVDISTWQGPRTWNRPSYFLGMRVEWDAEEFRLE